MYKSWIKPRVIDKQLAFISKTAQIHGHMDLRMFHELKVRKDIKYKCLSVDYFLLKLSCEIDCVKYKAIQIQVKEIEAKIVKDSSEGEIKIALWKRAC